jgi:hypothetical protein
MANLIRSQKRWNEDMKMETIRELEHLKQTVWLTTGQMIDQLKVGEIAVSEDGDIKLQYKNYFGLDTLHREKVSTGRSGSYTIHLSNLERKWRIIPKFVTFENAMQALKEGEIPTFLIAGKKIGLSDLLESKWTIEDGES